MHTTLQAIFWTSAVLVIYAYIGYPLVIYVLSRLFGRRQPPQDCPAYQLPQ
jgi:hypothetical protein